ncbi:MAG: hypothetical protein QOD26_1897 [Betaproteobacteria bacterium]|jgi:hypothetical protein|nr:hypothetical protein [Betaproteobacteria bacterium]
MKPKRPPQPPDFAAEISKTGFVLENTIAQELKSAGWTVISNRYYLDDVGEETPREIDLIAYRVGKLSDFQVYTVLIISCKKSADFAWALLARPIDLKDPNADWWPLHAWSNNKPIKYHFERPGIGRQYHDGISALGVTDALKLPSVEVFAFQEMDRRTGAPKNQTNIFQSLISLMKAQSYELNSLPLRRKQPAVYQFNLLTVVDADLIRLHFENNKVTEQPITSEHYIARYIVRKSTTVSRIRFVQANHLASCLPDYERLHDANCDWLTSQLQAFYWNITTDWDRLNVLKEDFQRRCAYAIRWRLADEFNEEVNWKDIEVEARPFTGKPAVIVPASPDALKWLNEDHDARAAAAKGLREIYRYHGEFFFDNSELPF